MRAQRTRQESTPPVCADRAYRAAREVCRVRTTQLNAIPGAVLFLNTLGSCEARGEAPAFGRLIRI